MFITTYKPIFPQRDETHLYGYVYFRQVRNTSLRRGYFQKSVVLLSSLPYFKFFKDVADIIAPEYFDNGEPCLEAGYTFNLNTQFFEFFDFGTRCAYNFGLV